MGGIAGAGRAGRHIVWDWNGTLFDDTDAVLRATNESLADKGLEPFTLETYRAKFTTPIPVFYERLLGYRPHGADWEAIDAAFHEAYHRHRVACQLTAGVLELLRSWRDGGGTQSLLSLYPHDALVPLVESFGLTSHFARVDGRDGPPGAPKHSYLVRHLTALGVAAASVTVIGDSVDDAAAAHAVGARAVLYSGGSHDRASLAATGAHVVDDLAAAVALAAD